MKKSDIIILIIILILIVSYIFIKLFTNNSIPILNEYAKRKSNNMITNIINKSISEVLSNEEYDSLISIDKNNNNEITNLNFNNEKINKLLYLTTDNLLEKTNKIENDKIIYYVPIGIIHSLPVLVNIGPKIPFKINILGDINNESKINIKEYGINNSMVEVFLNINVQIQVVLPFRSETFTINKQILLDNKIIQGNIPTYYGGLNYLLK